MVTKTPGKSKKVEREVIYPTRETTILDGDNSLTAEKMREYFGWEEVAQNGAGITEIRERMGVNARLTRNTMNRPITWSWVETLVQEVLNLRWRFNGTTIVLGTTGQVMQGQHRGLALIFADWEWEYGPNKEHWQTLSKGVRPTMELVLVTGVSEDDETFATLNREKPATFADTLYRSDVLPRKVNNRVLTPKQRRQIARILDHATKFLWLRTGAKVDPFAPRRTTTEAMEFYRQHRKLLDCVLHIYTADDPPKDESGKSLSSPISQFIPAGFAAALMYLMATSESDGSSYRDVPNVADRSEKKLKFSLWDRAAEFWSLVGKSDDLDQIRKSIIALREDRSITAGNNDFVATIVNAWMLWKDGEKLTPGKVKAQYAETDTGNLKLVQSSVGGIDTAGMLKNDILGIAEPTEPEKAEEPETQAETFRKKKERKKTAEINEQTNDRSSQTNGESPAAEKTTPANESVEDDDAGYE